MGTPADAIARRRAELLAQGGQSEGSGFGGSSFGAPPSAVASRRAQLLAAGGQSVGVSAPGPSTSAEGAALRGVGQGLTAEFGDELGAGIQAGLQGVANLLPEGSLEWAGISNDEQQAVGDVYRQARAGNREQLAADRREHGGAALLGNAAGGTVLGLIVPGGGTYGQSVGLGAAAGLGASEADLLEGDVKGAAVDTAIGAGLGAAGKYVGDKVVSGVGSVAAPVRDWLLRKAGAGKLAAAELAEAQAKDLVGKNVQQARSAAGSAASRARNTIENIEGINLPEGPSRTVGEAKAMLYEQLDAVDDAIASAIAKARAMGVDPNAIAPGRQGAFLSPGSKLDKAQKAAQQVRNLRAAREDVVRGVKELAGRADDDLLPDTASDLRAAQEALRGDPRLVDLKQNVLKNATADFPEVAAEAVARRNAFQQALSSQADDEAALAQRLLSGEEAAEQAKQRLQRYAAPLAGSLGGGVLGTAVGIGVGNDPADAALFGLAGAGARPALRSIQNLIKQPAVQNAAWSALEQLAQSSPQSFGKYAGAVTQALARGPEALRALDKVLRDTSPEWRQMREQQEKAAKGQK